MAGFDFAPLPVAPSALPVADPATRAKIEKTATDFEAAFLQVKDIPWSDQGELNGFHPTNDAAYNVIRDTAKETPQTTEALSKIAALGGQFGVSSGGIRTFR